MTWMTQWRRRTSRELAGGALVIAGLVALVVLVYVLVVVWGGALVGRTSSPDLVLSVVATAVVALVFDRAQALLERGAARLVYGGEPPPYDVWDRFSSTVAGTYPADELPARMARLLAEGTAARAAEVWLTVQDRPVLAATWPPGATPGQDEDPRRRALAVRYGGEEVGVLAVQERAPLTVVEERLFAGLADQAGLVLRSARLRVELQRRATELSERAEELRASRRRLVEVQDERRRVLERDIHDGAQQHLVALAVNLRLAESLTTRAPLRAQHLLDAQRAAAGQAIETLAQLSRGIYPPLLAQHGLAWALEAAAETSPVPVDVTAHKIGRYPAHLEAAAYFTCLEAVQNAVKHARASAIHVVLTGSEVALSLTVSDDGRGFDPCTATTGAGLANLRDRVESVGGKLHTDSSRGTGTRVHAVLPVPTPAVAGTA